MSNVQCIIDEVPTCGYGEMIEEATRDHDRAMQELPVRISEERVSHNLEKTKVQGHSNAFQRSSPHLPRKTA